MTALLMKNIAGFLLTTAFVVLLSVRCRGSSEARPCSENEVRCNNGECVLMAWWCDGDEDCLGGEDEANCDQGAAKRPCLVMEFRCASGDCIQDIFRCDGKADCEDLSDEADCDVAESCLEGQFMCKDQKRCILNAWKCDNKADCLDHSDETADLCGEKACLSTEFACDSGHQCIVGRWKCDGQKDCADGSDEECEDGSVICEEERGWFRCADRSCVSLSKVCDGTDHCPYGEDEGGHCESVCSDGTCDQKCFPTPGRAICMCHTGYRLEVDRTACADIDECQESPARVCSQRCTNIPGSYYCSCLQGYHLKPDKHTCKVTDGDPILLYSQAHQVQSVNLHTSEVKRLIGGRKNITDIAYDYVGKKGTLYWADQDNTSIYKTYLDHGPMFDAHVIPVVNIGLSKPFAVAVDWLSALVYITDLGRKQIIACRIAGDSCAIIIRLGQSDVPLAIVVDPPRGVMYWSSVGSDPYIAKGSMDGANWQKLVTHGVEHPSGLFVDDTTERLYWADPKKGRLASVNFDGTDVQDVPGEVGVPQSVVVFEDKVIWVERTSSSVLLANKFSGKGQKAIVKSISPPDSLLLTHPALCSKKESPCHHGFVCSNVCLPSEVQRGAEPGFSCACPEGYQLVLNHTTCNDSRSNPFFIVSHEQDIIKVDLNYIGKIPYRVFSVPSVKKIVALDFDPARAAAIYSDVTRRIIAARKVFTWETPGEEVLTPAGWEGDVNLLAMDWVAGNLIYTDSTKKSVEVVTLPTTGSRHYATLLEDLEGPPAALAVDPINGALFFSISGEDPGIRKCDLSCSQCDIMSLPIQECSGITVDQDKVYWVDSALKHIGVADLDGGSPQILVTDLDKPWSLAVHGEMVFWLDHGSDFVHQYSMSNRQIRRSALGGWEHMVGLTLVDWKKYTSVKNGCSENNGGCSQICLARGREERVCACQTDWALEKDQMTCRELDWCPPDKMSCDLGRCVKLSEHCDGIAQCDDGSDEADCDRTCSPGHFACVTGPRECVPNDWVCDLDEDCKDGSDEKNCEDTCGAEEFTCQSGDCVVRDKRCDGHPHCNDGSDEANCTGLSTSSPETCSSLSGNFRCSSGKCIAEYQLCDGRADCEEGEDEPASCEKPACEDTDFTCGDGYCVLLSYCCDGDPDCDDASDEDRDMCADLQSTTTTTQLSPSESCGNGTFECASGGCVPLRLVCDGTAHCGDGSDEGGLCDSACGETACSHVCTPTPSGSVCSCGDGYRMLPDNTTCQDINECAADRPVCSQMCENREGSYKCSCAPGYALTGDTRTCKAQGVRPSILLGRLNEIIELTLQGHHVHDVHSGFHGEVTSVDVNTRSRDLYWTTSQGAVFKWTKASDVEDVPRLSVEFASSVAHDWLTGNVYITDIRKLVVCADDLKWCQIVLRLSSEKPRGLALYPNKGLMFWIDGVLNSVLMKSWMTGQNQQPIRTHLVRPVSVTIDYVQDRVYLVDNLLGVLESSDFVGKNRQRYKGLKQPVSIDLFEDWVYVTDTHYKALLRVHKDGLRSPETLHRSLSRRTTVKVVHPLRQPNGDNPCKNLKCSHLCLLRPSGGSCACPIGYFFQEKSNTNCSNCSSYCHNGAVCTPVGSHLTCVCPPGFTGTQCQKQVFLPSPPSTQSKTSTPRPTTRDRYSSSRLKSTPSSLSPHASQQATSQTPYSLMPTTTARKPTVTQPSMHKSPPSVTPNKPTPVQKLTSEVTSNPNAVLKQSLPKSTLFPERVTSEPRPLHKFSTSRAQPSVDPNESSPRPSRVTADQPGSTVTSSVPLPISVPIAVSSSVPEANTTQTSSGRSEERGSGGVVAGVVVTLLLIVVGVVVVLVLLWRRGQKPSLAKLVWYHKGTAGHRKIGDQEELVPGGGIQNPVFEQNQDINFNISKGPILRYPSDASIDSAFISTGAGKTLDDYSGSTCQLIPPERA